MIKKSFVLISLLTLFSCTNDSQNKLTFIEDLDTLKEKDSRSLPMIDNIENTEMPEYDTFIQGEQIVHTFALQ